MTLVSSIGRASQRRRPMSATCGRGEDTDASAVDNRWNRPVDSMGTRWGRDVNGDVLICGNSSSLWAPVHEGPVAPQSDHTLDTPSDLREQSVIPDSHSLYYDNVP